MYLIRTRLGRSRIQGAGIGLFAAEPIQAGQVVWELSPWHCEFDPEEVDELPLAAQELILYFGFFDRVANCYGLDIDNGRFTNHSDTPNLRAPDGERRCCLVAVCDIEAGEELTINYRAVDGMVRCRVLRRGTPYRDFLDRQNNEGSSEEGKKTHKAATLSGFLIAVTGFFVVQLSANAQPISDHSFFEESVQEVVDDKAHDHSSRDRLVIDGEINLAEVVQMAFIESPDLEIARVQVRGAEGELMEAQGPFDRDYFFSLGYEKDVFESYIETYSFEEESRARILELGVTQLFRTGVEVTPSLQLRSERSLYDESANPPQENVAVVRLDISVPLLPYERQRFVWPERAGEHSLEAARQEQARSTAEKAYEVVEAYWQYSAAHKNYQLALSSKERTKQLLEQVKALIEVDEMPAVQADSVHATLENRRLQKLVAADDVVVARNRLANVIGLAPEQARLLPQPAESFAQIDPSNLPSLEQHPSLVARALEQRNDLSTLRQREQAAFEAMEGARLNRGGALDLDLFIGYRGGQLGSSESDYFGSVGEINVGPSFGVGLTYSLAPAQRSQSGVYLQRSAERDEFTISRIELKRSIATNLETGLISLRQSASRALRAERSVDLHRRAVDREIERHQLGQATISEVLRAKDELTDSEYTLVTQREEFSITLAAVLLKMEEIVVFSPDALKSFDFALAQALGRESIVEN
ncbi:TolC family protein [Halorhodospira abdelmalekii]|uniref:TolC family protein n=1 Tax=Halorhodospira abdelmalekii TaxID=421629 RepID=UPI001904942A